MKAAILLTGRFLNTAAVVAPPVGRNLAYRLFFRPTGRAKVHPREQDVHAAATVGQLDLDGVPVSTYAWGDGRRPVLLVHGWSSRGSRYAGMVSELLHRGYSPVTFDAPGHGDSGGSSTNLLQYERVMHLLQQRHGDFAAVVAHSFGVPCAFHALRTGLRADRLVAVSGPAEFDHLVTEFSRQLRLRPSLAEHLRVQSVRDIGVPDLWERFSSVYEPTAVTVPLLIVHDEDDDVVGVDHGRRLHAAYPGSRLLVTSGLGHRRILGDPRIVGPVADFLDAAAPVPR
ncbi:alpha/beta hydrolase [Catellatospora sp. TT07R-123]|uniref:alpha/beta fold hydrolase n=1 Tax=Catellatospora sp. TT07R-123 TaxID=2733863 RepID=UPI001B0D0E44|nr:alpha/beta hydrolase [Catellatospora sp. TT07R-123]GHJ47609.1 alpha/beta hydrolase [Catellatospora sp. TT07R-123]